MSAEPLGEAPVLELESVAKTVVLPTGDRLNILSDVSISVAGGEVVAIVGRSGSGKSTLLNILGLLDTVTSGRFTLSGVDVREQADAELARLRGEHIGFVFQQFHLFDRRNALENVSEPLLFGGGAARRSRRETATAILERVGLGARRFSYPGQLSGGEQQRVAIARALVRKPRIVLADEPTGALDATTGEMILDLLMSLVRTEGVTLMLVTHDMEIARRADRILMLGEGRLFPFKDILSASSEPYLHPASPGLEGSP